jgi:hypothetical protein
MTAAGGEVGRVGYGNVRQELDLGPRYPPKSATTRRVRVICFPLMSPPKRGPPITRILERAQAGVPLAEGVFPLMYDELRRLAAAHLGRERPDHRPCRSADPSLGGPWRRC